MMAYTTVSSIETPTNTDSAEFSRQIASYQIAKVDERHSEYEAIGRMAACIQGEDYIRSGYIEPEKLMDDGCMPDDIDRDKCDVVYYVAYPNGKGLLDTQAALKKITPRQDESLDDLPAYRYSKDALYPEWDAYLAEHPSRIAEIGGLCRLNEVESKMVSHELMRDIVQQAIRSRSDEMWLITFAEKAHRAMIASFGEDVIQQVGEPLVIDEPDEHVVLRPCIIEPGMVIENLARTIRDDTPEELKVRRSMALLLMADGLRSDEMSENAKLCLDEIRSALS